MNILSQRLLVFLIALSLAATIAVAADKPAGEKKIVAPVVTIAEAREREIVETVQVTGTLVAREEILVGPEIEGLRILELLVDEGDVVTRGQVLARLSKDTLLAQVAQSDAQLGRADAAIEQSRSNITLAEAGVAQSEPALTRARTLMKTGASTEAVLEQRTSEHISNLARLNSARRGLALSEADKKNIQALREELNIRLARAEVKAPAAGLVSRRNARVGGVASMSAEAMFRLIADGDVELDAEIPEFRLHNVRAGQKAAVLPAGENRIEARVRLVSPEVDRATRMGKARISAGRDTALRIGTFARGEIETQRRRAIAIPASAVLYDSAGAYAQSVVGDKVVTRRIKVGLVAAGFAEVMEGLVGGDVVILRAGAFLNDGDIVDPRRVQALAGEREAREQMGSR